MENNAHFRERLEEEKKTLESELTSVGRRNPSNPADWEAEPKDAEQEADPNDAADHINEYEGNTAILKELETRYNDVLAALARLEEGSFGVCEVGGEPIEEDRLEADPAAKTCKAHMQ